MAGLAPLGGAGGGDLGGPGRDLLERARGALVPGDVAPQLAVEARSDSTAAVLIRAWVRQTRLVRTRAPARKSRIQPTGGSLDR